MACRIRSMDIQNIPWPTIEAKLNALGHNQAWLARSLNVGTNVIANWRSRGGAPLARVGDLARTLGCSADELLNESGSRVAKRESPKDRALQSDALEVQMIRTFRAMSPAGQAEVLRYAEYLRAREGSTNK